MGRKSKLNPTQWAEIERRIIEGESARALAREFGIGESSIRERVSARVAEIKSVANQIISTERAVMALPISAQITAHTLASKLRTISSNLASAAEYGSATALRLNALANSEVSRVDDAAPMDSLENLRNVGVLTKLANESANIALNLLSSNKDRISKMDEEERAEEAAVAEMRPKLTREEWERKHGLGIT